MQKITSQASPTVNLNPDQLKAVEHVSGSLLVTACAGSGKTRVITHRIAHLIREHAVPPRAIVALTFTNKAANEMKERVAQLIDDADEMPFIGTFHSYCVRLLKSNQDLLETPFVSILDEEDRRQLVNDLLKQHGAGKQLNARAVIHQISQAKNGPPDVARIVSSDAFSHPLVYEIYCGYEKEKQASRCLDFDDLLRETYRLFHTQPIFKQLFQERVRHLLVDEYQDTNELQHALLRHMTQHEGKTVADSVCAVGDEDQSIYSWRGATIANIIGFRRDFPKTTAIKIEQNYRSVQPILELANNLITHNTNRTPKKMWSERTGKNRILSLACTTEYQEAAGLAQLVKKALTNKRASQIAFLYRTHAQSRALEEALVREALPYRIIGGVQFYERREVKDILSYLKLIANPFDRTALTRIINTPPRGLGPKFIEQLKDEWADETERACTNILGTLKNHETVTNAKRASLENFLGILDDARSASKPSQMAEQIILRTQYLRYLKDTEDPQHERERTENIKELLSAIRHFEENSEKPMLEGFLEEVTLMQERSKGYQDGDAVQLMTLHAAKGLEFDLVAITGLEEGTFPAYRAFECDDALEEERRLLYVGITRAREHLLLTNAHTRSHYGSRNHQQPSRFLQELGGQTPLMQADASRWYEHEFATTFSKWLRGEKPVQTSSVRKRAPQTPRTSQAHSARTTHTTPTSSSIGGGIAPRRVVRHQTYGLGVVENITGKDEQAFALVKFGNVRKKIAVSFLKPV